MGIFAVSPYSQTTFPTRPRPTPQEQALIAQFIAPLQLTTLPVPTLQPAVLPHIPPPIVVPATSPIGPATSRTNQVPTIQQCRQLVIATFTRTTETIRNPMSGRQIDVMNGTLHTLLNRCGYAYQFMTPEIRQLFNGECTYSLAISPYLQTTFPEKPRPTPAQQALIVQFIAQNPQDVPHMPAVQPRPRPRPVQRPVAQPQVVQPQVRGSTRFASAAYDPVFRPEVVPFSLSTTPVRRSAHSSSSLSQDRILSFAKTKCGEILRVRTSPDTFIEIDGVPVYDRIPIINDNNRAFYNSREGSTLKKFVNKLSKACIKLINAPDIPLDTIITNINDLKNKYSTAIQLPVVRGVTTDNELKDLYHYYKTIDIEDMFKRSITSFYVRYADENEVGIDAGGISKQFFQKVADTIFLSGLFIQVEPGSVFYTFNWNVSVEQFNESDDDEGRARIFNFLGKLIAFLMIHEIKFDGHLTKAIFANLLYKTTNDPETNEIFDEDYPIYYIHDSPTESKSLLNLMDTPADIIHTGIEFNTDELVLDSTITNEDDNTVSAKNYNKYFNKVAKYKLIGGDKEKALKEFKKGFFISRRFLRNRKFTINILDTLTSGGKITSDAIESIINKHAMILCNSNTANDQDKILARWIIDILRNTGTIIINKYYINDFIAPPTARSSSDRARTCTQNVTKLKEVIGRMAGVNHNVVKIDSIQSLPDGVSIGYYFNVNDRSVLSEKIQPLFIDTLKILEAQQKIIVDANSKLRTRLPPHEIEVQQTIIRDATELIVASNTRRSSITTSNNARLLSCMQEDFERVTYIIADNPYPIALLTSAGHSISTLSESWATFISNFLFFWTANRNYSDVGAYKIAPGKDLLAAHTCFQLLDLPYPGRGGLPIDFSEYYAKIIEFVASALGFTMT
jgi:hypothetical protein